MTAGAPGPTGTIHDLGYKRYLGTRRAQSTRWQVITRQQLSAAWKKWWRYKAWLALAVVITGIVVAVMVLSRSDKMSDLGGAQTMVIRFVDEMVFRSFPFLLGVGFLVSLTAGAGVIASDLRTGAFTFYFARPVRPVDYVIGKLVALWALQAAVMLAPLIVIVAVRLGLSQTTDELIDTLPLVPKVLLAGGLCSLAYAAISLGVSSLLDSPRLTMAMWAGWFLIGAGSLSAVALFVLEIPSLGTIDLSFAMTSLAFGLFGVEEEMMAPVPAAIVGLVLYVAAGVALAYSRVDAAAHRGIGGS